MDQHEIDIAQLKSYLYDSLSCTREISKVHSNIEYAIKLKMKSFIQVINDRTSSLNMNTHQKLMVKF